MTDTGHLYVSEIHRLFNVSAERNDDMRNKALAALAGLEEHYDKRDADQGRRADAAEAERDEARARCDELAYSHRIIEAERDEARRLMDENLTNFAIAAGKHAALQQTKLTDERGHADKLAPYVQAFLKFVERRTEPGWLNVGERRILEGARTALSDHDARRKDADA